MNRLDFGLNRHGKRRHQARQNTTSGCLELRSFGRSYRHRLYRLHLSELVIRDQWQTLPKIIALAGTCGGIG
jgi:hypothetical protein